MTTLRRSRTRRRVALAVVPAMALAVLASSTPAGAGPAPGREVTAAGENQPCLDNVGITVVVDFQELGGGVNVRCAPGVANLETGRLEVTDGFDALKQAGITYQTTVRFAGFLCKIAGKPADDPCIDTSPAGAYWSYWVAPRGGQWCYSNLGAGARTRPLPPGSIEGWSFSKDRRSTTTSPPRYRPPGPVPGQVPSPIPTSDCDGVVPLPPNPPPVTPPPPPPPPPSPSTSPGAAPAVGGDRTGSPGATGTPGEPGATVAAPGTSVAPVDEVTSTTAATDPGATPAEGSAAEDGAEDEVALGLVRTNADGSIEALGDVDLASDGSSGGSPVALVAVAVAVVGLGVGGVVIAVRRRRATLAQ